MEYILYKSKDNPAWRNVLSANNISSPALYIDFNQFPTNFHEPSSCRFQTVWKTPVFLHWPIVGVSGNFGILESGTLAWQSSGIWCFLAIRTEISG
jgi:hypothetical protein